MDTALVVRSEDGGGQKRRKKELSEDLIVEIFTRLRVKSLMRFRCISKHWYNLILSPNFISMHSALGHRNNKQPVTLLISSIVKTVTATNITYRFEEEEDVVQELRLNHCPVNRKYFSVRKVGSSNGVVCLSLSEEPQNYALWNPATRQVRVIADCPLNCFAKHRNGYSSGFSFDAVTNSFKLAQIEFTEEEEEEEETMAQIHVFSTATNSWTEKKNVTVPYPMRLHSYHMARRGTCVNGYLHWHIVLFRPGSELQEYYTQYEMINEQVEDMYILSYDIINEAFERIELPFRHVSSAQYVLDGYRGSLALFVLSHQTASNVPSPSVIDVWAMNHHRGSSPSWSKIPTCKPSIEVSYVKESIKRDDVGFILLGLEPKDDMYLYDPLNGETKDALKRESKIVSFRYCESLASLN